MRKRVFYISIILMIVLSCLSGMAAFAQEGASVDSSQQIVSEGGDINDDYIAVSKTIAGTEAENVFDISLKVVTKSSIEELYVTQDTAVVIVMDISNTMVTNKMSDGRTRYDGAIDAAEQFLTSFCEMSMAEPEAELEVGFVAFNTDAHEIFPLSSCRTDMELNALVSDMKGDTEKIVKDKNYNSSITRYTNIEGGLARAESMLSGSAFENKYIIFLSDGFPTTYLRDAAGFKGYRPVVGYDFSSFRPNADGSIPVGHFYDKVRNLPCSWGTSYSDRGAERAQARASALKRDGTQIFSVGLGLGDTTLQEYIDQQYVKNNKGELVLRSFSVVDCYSEDYVIGAADDTGAYKNWLRDKIGSGYYYDNNDTEGLKQAFSDIFRTIRILNREKIQASWTVSDPMGALDTACVEFISLYDREGNFSSDPNALSGSLGEGSENTVTVKNGTIIWKLWDSGYTSLHQENTALYYYELTYRVRLENELEGFEEGGAVNTNGTTTLSYIHDLNGVLTPGSLEFPIPAVKGWLGELSFKKTGADTGEGLAGAEFSLSHNEDCSVCAMIYPGGWPVGIDTMTAVSAADGAVSFKNIPSGHEYSLAETQAPEGYEPHGGIIPVTVAYDVTTVGGAEGFDSFVNRPLCELTVFKAISGEYSRTDFLPGSFTIEVKNEAGESVAEISLPYQDGSGMHWEHSFTGLSAGKYTLYESYAASKGEGYVCTPKIHYPDNGSSVELAWDKPGRAGVENHYEYVPDTVTVNAVKHWDDGGDRDGLRPRSISFTLSVGGVDVDTKTADASNGFSVSFSYDARKYPKDAQVNVRESGYTDKNGGYHSLAPGQNVPGYSSSRTVKDNSYEITNIHSPETVRLRVEKRWTQEAEANARPVTFRLLADGEEINSVTLDGSEGWSHVFDTDREGNTLYACSGGVRTDYSIVEDSLGEHWQQQTEVSGSHWVITNDYHVPEPVYVPLSAVKYLDNREAHGSSFSFVLKDGEGNVLQTVNNEGGAINFEPLKFDKEGSYVYYINELKGSDNKIKYDSSVYTLSVEVTLDRDYRADVTVSLGGNERPEGIAFFNGTRTSPPTGDRNNVALYAAVMLLSAAAAAGALYFIKRRR